MQQCGAQNGFDFVITIHDKESGLVGRQNRSRLPIPFDANLTAMIDRRQIQRRSAGGCSRDAKTSSQRPDSQDDRNQQSVSGFAPHVSNNPYYAN